MKLFVPVAPGLLPGRRQKNQLSSDLRAWANRTVSVQNPTCLPTLSVWPVQSRVERMSFVTQYVCVRPHSAPSAKLDPRSHLLSQFSGSRLFETVGQWGDKGADPVSDLTQRGPPSLIVPDEQQRTCSRLVGKYQQTSAEGLAATSSTCMMLRQ